DRALVADLALDDGLLRRALVLPELELPRHDVLAPEPEADLLVADVLTLRSELDRVRRGAVDRLLALEARARVGLAPGHHLVDQVEVVVAEVGAHEALVPRLRGDLPDALQLGQVEPLVGGPALVRVGEEAGPLHLGGGEEEADRLLLVAALLPLVQLELADALAAALVDDRHL